MAHSIRILDNLGLVVLRYWGDVTYEEIREVFDEWVRLPGFLPHLKALIDFRQATTQVSGDEVQKLAAYAHQTDALWGDTKWAVLAPSDVIYGLSRMYSALTVDYDVKTHVFRTPEEANDWLGVGINVGEILLGAAE